MRVFLMLWDAQNKAKLKMFVCSTTSAHSIIRLQPKPVRLNSVLPDPRQFLQDRLKGRALLAWVDAFCGSQSMGQTQSLPEAGELREWILEEYRTAPGP